MKSLEHYSTLSPEKILSDVAYSTLRIPSDLPIGDWAEKTLMIPQGVSALYGNFSLDETPYMRGVLNAYADPKVQQVVWMSSAQVGKTTAMLIVLAWAITEAQGMRPIIFVTANAELAEQFAAQRFQTLLDANEDVARMFHSEGNTVMQKRMSRSFDGNSLEFMSAGVKAGITGRSTRFIFADELSKWANPIALAELEKRTATLRDSKIFYASTPTHEDDLIEQKFLMGSQDHYYVPCLKCGTLQRLFWEHLRYKVDGEVLKEPYYECAEEECKHKHYEKNKRSMLLQGVWRSAAPDVKNIRSFHINELYSLFTTWKNMADNWRSHGKDKDKRRDFINLSLGETWRSLDNTFDSAKVYARREDYVGVPAEVKMLVAGVDVQQDRIELEIIGYGEGWDSWGIKYMVIPMEPTRYAKGKYPAWDKLAEILDADYGGRKISCAGIDAGYQTKLVYSFVIEKWDRPWYPVMGDKSRGFNGHGRWNTNHNIEGLKDTHKPLIRASSHLCKEDLFTMLRADEKGNGFCHYNLTYGNNYFDMLCAEKKLDKIVGGMQVSNYIKVNKHNEAIDCRVYAKATAEYYLEFHQTNLALFESTQVDDDYEISDVVDYEV